ncbi:M48 family metallopeptidase [Cupriavidus pauculus]|uniref:Metal-dependent hydrolase n=1 Tax=Cupriavidus pauculus TaxID=82633 RepID=A0A2N5CHK2_9BURK|nr:M48 family metallopeptidase [Cupriavidus pauculus]PLQ01698.1 metal-dependent hydrolase [Cupriavidus pauculus]
MRFLGGYPPNVLDQVRAAMAAGTLGDHIARRYPERHTIQTDRALYDYTSDIKQEYLRSAPPLHKVGYDARLDTAQHALGLHTAISRVQGGKLKAKKEIRVASLFKEAPPEFLRMIVVHELAHLKESDHNKAFYRLCEHMEPQYHQLEFDTRLFLAWREMEKAGSREAARP